MQTWGREVLFCFVSAVDNRTRSIKRDSNVIVDLTFFPGLEFKAFRLHSVDSHLVFFSRCKCVFYLRIWWQKKESMQDFIGSICSSCFSLQEVLVCTFEDAVHHSETLEALPQET